MLGHLCTANLCASALLSGALLACPLGGRLGRQHCTLALPGGHLSLWSLRTWSLGTRCHAVGCLPLRQPPRGVNDGSLCMHMPAHIQVHAHAVQRSSVQLFWGTSSVRAQHTWAQPRSRPCAHHCGCGIRSHQLLGASRLWLEADSL